MPYIKRTERVPLDPHVDALAAQLRGHGPGALNYAITSLILRSQNISGYYGMNEVAGVLECVKLELYRRMIGPYEDSKIRENGDVC